jgi:ferric-dicitrate binding protein FerR (iron transport regulator)
MPATSQPTNPNAGQLISDEAALERLFRAHYVELLTEAKTKLPKAETAAPRVVSKAFHMAWNDRAQFKTQEELMAFLRSTVQHVAAREISRRAGLHRADHAISGSTHETEAAHHAAHHDPVEMGIDEAWDRLKHTLHGGAPEAYRKRASTARHEAAEHMAALAKTRSWKGPIAIGLVALVAIAGTFWFLDREGEGRRIAAALASSEIRAYESPGNRLINVTLDDGTVVNLGPESRLIVPKLFGPNMRAVKVEGSAHFNVVQAMDKPFRAYVGDAIVLARGTAFTVRRYADDSAAIIRVREGNVDVMVGEQVRNLPAEAAIKVVDGGTFREASTTDVEETASWVDGRVIISGRTLRYVLPRMKRFYGLDIKVPDPKLLERQVFLSAALNSPREAITSLEQSGGLKFTYVGENMTFADTLPSRGARRR